MRVNKSNLKLLVKLDKVKPFTHYDSHPKQDKSIREHGSLSMKTTTKRKIIETERENNRIFHKMKSVSSTIGK